MKGLKHPDLRKEKKLTGLPSLAFLDEKGVVLLKVPFQQRNIAGLRKSAVRAGEYLLLRAAVAKGDAKARPLFLRMQLQERQLDLPAAQKLRKGLEGKPELLAELDQLLLHLSISTQLREAGQKKRAELGPAFWKMWTQGPKPGLTVGRGFWYAILEWAEREKKVGIFAQALQAFRESLAVTDPGATWVPNLLRRYEDKLSLLQKD